MFIFRILVYITFKIKKFIQKVVSLTILGLIFAAQTMLVLLVTGLIYLRELFKHFNLDYAGYAADDFFEDCSQDVMIPELFELMNIAKTKSLGSA